MISWYLFRDDVIIDTGTSMWTFDEVSNKDDRMLCMRYFIMGYEFSWSSFRMTLFVDNIWGWSPMPDEETTRLRALLLLQQ